jgi:transcriptional regulator with XRE-family HTH domain
MEETEFGQRIKDLRIGYGLTQQSLAEKFNVHRTTVKDWEVRGKEPDYATLCKLAQFLRLLLITFWV